MQNESRVPSSVRPGAKAEGRTAVLQAAAEAFMDLGYDRASIDEIADRMGATKGRVYHYYRSKADILLDVHQDMLAIMMDALREEAGQETDPFSRLRAMSRQHVLLMMEHFAYARVTLVSTTQLDGSTERQRQTVRRIRETRKAYEQLFTDVITEAVEKGMTQPPDIPVATKAVLGVLNWIGMWYDPERTSTADGRVALADQLADFAVAGLRHGAE